MSLYSLYPITDQKVSRSRNLFSDVEKLCKGGIKILQIREKELSSRDFYAAAKKAKIITDRFKVKLIINDRVDIVLAIDAAGVHLGQSDLPLKVARKILSKEKIIGVSCNSVRQALQAEQEGADYVSAQAIFPTQTKLDVEVKGKKLLREMLAQVSVPVIAIGGINEENLDEVLSLGCKNIAMISALLGAKDVQKTTAQILKRIVC